MPLAAAATPDISERAVRLDQTIQALKDETVELTREAQAIETDALIPEYERVSVYLGVGVRGLLLESVSVAIDDRAPEVYHYEEQDARALLAEHSLHRVLRTSVAPGPHRIRVSFTGRYADDKPDAPPVTSSYEAIFDKDHREAELEFRIVRASRFGNETRLSMKQWRKRQ
ncbi:hypothetical protein SAMN04488120_1058 [Fontimonas thermophila]|uniref:AraC family transcriptional regulator n=1 Tax=Fontimonas thermophila TaxID=1076937 RepID=A0A1I2IXB2_9GAMM|nr:hypothetical protein [Fontimonas thermophila]SFF46934.1 hypothetical protein SAMN04488120_1058 [Fontimonas thermophila]